MWEEELGQCVCVCAVDWALCPQSSEHLDVHGVAAWMLQT